MLIIITGASGSGKSSISSYLASLNSKIVHLNIDEIAHLVISKKEVIKELITSFNLSPLEDGSINRKGLADIVFNNQLKMDRLTEITWKYMEEEIDNIILKNKDKIIILDWLLITKTKYFNDSDLKILVKSDSSERTKRAVKRDHISEEKFLERDKARVTYDESKFNYIIENNNIDISKRKVKMLYDKSIVSRKF